MELFEFILCLLEATPHSHHVIILDGKQRKGYCDWFVIKDGEGLAQWWSSEKKLKKVWSWAEVERKIDTDYLRKGVMMKYLNSTYRFTARKFIPWVSRSCILSLPGYVPPPPTLSTPTSSTHLDVYISSVKRKGRRNREMPPPKRPPFRPPPTPPTPTPPTPISPTQPIQSTPLTQSNPPIQPNLNPPPKSPPIPDLPFSPVSPLPPSPPFSPPPSSGTLSFAETHKDVMDPTDIMFFDEFFKEIIV